LLAYLIIKIGVDSGDRRARCPPFTYILKIFIHHKHNGGTQHKYRRVINKCNLDTHVSILTRPTHSRLNNPKLQCGPMPNVMVALPNIGGAISSTPQSLPDAHYLTAVQ